MCHVHIHRCRLRRTVRRSPIFGIKRNETVGLAPFQPAPRGQRNFSLSACSACSAVKKIPSENPEKVEKSAQLVAAKRASRSERTRTYPEQPGISRNSPQTTRKKPEPIRKIPEIPILPLGHYESANHWQSGQMPKNSSRWETRLKPAAAAMRCSISGGKQSVISTTLEQERQTRW